MLRITACKKQIFNTAGILFFLILVSAGCDTGQLTTEPEATTVWRKDELSIYKSFAAAGVKIIPITGFVNIDDKQQDPGIRVFVRLTDESGNSIKAPAVFRFELYEKVILNPEPRGKRLAIWSDFDLTDFKDNSTRWRDFLRGYEFNLAFEPEPERTYIIQATCRCPDGRRLSSEFEIKH